jgi:hypothetical protein
VALVITDVWEEHIASIIRETRIGELGTTLAFLVTANVVLSSLIVFTLTMEAIRFSEMSVITIATRRSIREDGILHGHRLKT